MWYKVSFHTHPHCNTDFTVLDNTGFNVISISVNGNVLSPTCTVALESTCELQWTSENVQETVEVSDYSTAYASYQFWVFLLLMVIAWLGQAVAVSLGDAICFEMLGKMSFSSLTVN